MWKESGRRTGGRSLCGQGHSSGSLYGQGHPQGSAGSRLQPSSRVGGGASTAWEAGSWTSPSCLPSHLLAPSPIIQFPPSSLSTLPASWGRGPPWHLLLLQDFKGHRPGRGLHSSPRSAHALARRPLALSRKPYAPPTPAQCSTSISLTSPPHPLNLLLQ